VEEQMMAKRKVSLVERNGEWQVPILFTLLHRCIERPFRIWLQSRGRQKKEWLHVAHHNTCRELPNALIASFLCSYRLII